MVRAIENKGKSINRQKEIKERRKKMEIAASLKRRKKKAPKGEVFVTQS